MMPGYGRGSRPSMAESRAGHAPPGRVGPNGAEGLEPNPGHNAVGLRIGVTISGARSDDFASFARPIDRT